MFRVLSITPTEAADPPPVKVPPCMVPVELFPMKTPNPSNEKAFPLSDEACPATPPVKVPFMISKEELDETVTANPPIEVALPES